MRDPLMTQLTSLAVKYERPPLRLANYTVVTLSRGSLLALLLPDERVGVRRKISLVFTTGLNQQRNIRVENFSDHFKDISEPTQEEITLFEIDHPEAYKQLNNFMGEVYGKK